MKAITLYQPWASWIAAGLKTIETRGHARFACLLGQRIAIHAGLKFDTYALVEARTWAPAEVRNHLVSVLPCPNGAVVCTAYVRAFRRLTAADSSAALCDCSDGRRWGLFLTDIRSVTGGKRVCGGRSIFEVDLVEEPQATPLLDVAEAQRARALADP